MEGSHSFTCHPHVSIHQMAPSEKGKAHPITAHCSFIDLEKMKGWVGLVSWPCSGLSPIGYRSSVGQRKFAGHRPTFYHCACASGQRILTETLHEYWMIPFSAYTAAETPNAFKWAGLPQQLPRTYRGRFRVYRPKTVAHPITNRTGPLSCRI